jgi:magnesium chelatase family protein
VDVKREAWRVARTIADLEAVPTVGKQQLAEAICFRSYDQTPRAKP